MTQNCFSLPLVDMQASEMASFPAPFWRICRFLPSASKGINRQDARRNQRHFFPFPDLHDVMKNKI